MFKISSDPTMGPGATDPGNNFGSKAKNQYYFGAKIKTKQAEPGVDPGQYQPQEGLIRPKVKVPTMKKKPKKINRATWLESPTKDVPDAGEYDYDRAYKIVKPAVKSFAYRKEEKILVNEFLH